VFGVRNEWRLAAYVVRGGLLTPCPRSVSTSREAVSLHAHRNKVPTKMLGEHVLKCHHDEVIIVLHVIVVIVAALSSRSSRTGSQPKTCSFTKTCSKLLKLPSSAAKMCAKYAENRLRSKLSRQYVFSSSPHNVLTLWLVCFGGLSRPRTAGSRFPRPVVTLLSGKSDHCIAIHRRTIT